MTELTSNHDRLAKAEMLERAANYQFPVSVFCDLIDAAENLEPENDLQRLWVEYAELTLKLAEQHAAMPERITRCVQKFAATPPNHVKKFIRSVRAVDWTPSELY